MRKNGLNNFKISDFYYESYDGGKTWVNTDIIDLEEYYLIHYNWGEHGKFIGFFHRTDLALTKEERENDNNYINCLRLNRQIIPIIN